MSATTSTPAPTPTATETPPSKTRATWLDLPDTRPLLASPRGSCGCRWGCVWCRDPDDARDDERERADDEGRVYFGGRWI